MEHVRQLYRGPQSLVLDHSRGAWGLARADHRSLLALMAPGHPDRPRSRERVSRWLLQAAGHVPVLSPRPGAVVVTPPEDARHPEQLQLAEELRATVVLVLGGHMYPIADPRGAANNIIVATQTMRTS